MRLTLPSLVLGVLTALALSPSAAAQGGFEGSRYCAAFSPTFDGPAACSFPDCSTSRPLLLVGSGQPGTTFRLTCGTAELACEITLTSPLCIVDGTGLAGSSGAGSLVAEGPLLLGIAFNGP